MSVTSRGNIGHLKDYSYPTIRIFLHFIQLFDVEFMTVVPHNLMVFHLQYAKHVKIASSIDTYAIYAWKVCKEKKSTCTSV